MNKTQKTINSGLHGDVSGSESSAVRKGWETKRLGEVCDIRNGSTPAKSNPAFWDGGTIPWFTIDDMREQGRSISHTRQKITETALTETSVKLLPPDSVLLCCTASVGEFAITRIPVTTNQQFNGLVVKNRRQIEPNFLFYYAATFKEELLGLSGKMTIDFIPISRLRNINIPVPPLPEQQRIVGVLDKAFAGLSTAQVNAEKNLRNARALFESHLQSVFRDAWQGSELVKLADLATDITDGDHLPPPKASKGVPFITIGNIVKNTRLIDFSNTFMVPRSYFDALKSHKKPQKGDVLYTVTGSFGIPVLVQGDVEFCFQRHIGLVRPKHGINSTWLYYLLLSPQIFKQANDGANGAAQKTVSLKLLRSFIVPRVSTKKQNIAVTQLDALATETQRLESLYQQKLTAFAALKKSLLHQAFSGEL